MNLYLKVLTIVFITCLTLNYTVVSATSTNSLVTTSTNETNYPTTIITQGNLPESQLGLNNVLLILVFVVGLVIILLGFAILIRLKS